MTSVKITVESSLGDVEVEQESLYESFDNQKDNIQFLLNNAVEKVRKAYDLER